jgi:hypothetical protein
MDGLTWGFASFTAAFFGVLLLLRLSSVEQRLNALSRLNGKLDALLQHAGIEFDPYGDVAPEIAQALERGKKIEAIKLYRAASGVGLKEAKEFVEELQRRGGRA